MSILLQQIAESYLLAHAALIKLTRPWSCSPTECWRSVSNQAQHHRPHTEAVPRPLSTTLSSRSHWLNLPMLIFHIPPLPTQLCGSVT